MKLISLLNYHKPIDKNEKVIVKDVETLDVLEELTPHQTTKYGFNNVDRFYCFEGGLEILVYKNNLENGEYIR